MSEIDSNFEIEDLANPKDELKKRIVALAGTIRKWNEETVKVRKSVRKQLEEIIDIGLNKRNMKRSELRGLVEEIFRYYNISESWFRKLLPVELKDTSKTRISYLQKQKMEEERQRLLQQQVEDSQHHPDIRAFKPEAIQLSSETRGEVEMDYASEYDHQDHRMPSPSNSNELTKVQNQLSEAYGTIKKLETDIRRLSEEFTAKTNLQAYSETFPLIARIDPVKKAIIQIGFEKSSSI